MLAHDKIMSSLVFIAIEGRLERKVVSTYPKEGRESSEKGIVQNGQIDIFQDWVGLRF